MIKNEIFIKKSIDIHGDKYDYSLVEYINSKTKVKIICKKHGVFEQRPDMHLYKKHGCPTCGGKNISNIDYINRFRNIHGDKYDYSLMVYKSCETPIKIICKLHGVFEQAPYNHSMGQNCPKCIGRLNDLNLMILVFKNIHGDKYDYSLIKEYDKKNKLKIICKIHGVFEQTYSTHKKSKGCPKCINRNKTEVDIIEDFKLIHKNEYDYSLIEYKNSKTKVKIICKKHGIFEQSPNSHLKGRGCPICSKSKGELIVKDILDEFGIKYIQEYRLSNSIHTLRADFYLVNYNKIIEYNGIQHYYPNDYFGGESEFKLLIERDNRKKIYCKQNNIDLLIIPYTIKKIDDIKNIILKFIKKDTI